MFDEEFFPTPPHVVSKMLDRVSRSATHFLEPSAGKGDIADAIRERSRYDTVDCIERSPELVSVLVGKGHLVVGYDWLDYSGVSYYDAIVMNPPFSNGDEHLLRAWDFLHSGEIVCLLNEETVINTYTASRQRLAEVIRQHGDIEYLGDCFGRGVERTTGVRVAMVYLRKVSEDDSADLWAKSTEEKTANDDIGGNDPHMIAIRDNLGNLQHHYDHATEQMLKAFQHLRKAAVYMGANGIAATDDYAKIVGLALKNVNDARAEFVRKHRRDAWMSVFVKMEFRRWLDKKQRESFVRDIERNGNIPFTKENIKGTLQNVFLQRSKLFEQSVANVFDELTRYFKGNTSHTEGWKSNDSFKVNRKIVFPYGCTFDWGSFKLWWGRAPIDIYNDLDRVLCVLAGENFEDCVTIQKALEARFSELGTRQTELSDKVAESRFFDIRFFKKGTVHLVFRDESLWKQFNVTASKGKAWIGQET